MRHVITHYRDGKLIEYRVDEINPPVKTGDKIGRIAQPIARAVDRVAGTKIAKCGGCKKMRDRLNAGLPFREALKLRIQGK